MNILYAASEANPFAKSGGLADVAGSLPKALVRDGIDARVVMPLYGDLKMRDKLTYVTNFSVPVGWRSQYCGLFTAVVDGVTYYFLDNEYYFKRAGLYGFYDDGERFAFFSRAVLEMLFYADFAPDIINCNDWQTGLVPVYLNLYYRHLDKFNRIKTIFTIHNIAYQGKYGLEILEDTCGISKRDHHIVEYDGCANFMKGAIETADKVTTVSPTYAQEILDPWFAHGLDALLREKQYKLCGILNGIDTEVNDPSTDPNLAAHYSVKSFKTGKKKCKEALQDHFALEKDGSPVFAVVSRLVGMKGLDLLQSIADGLVNDCGIELVVLGTGENGYEAYFSDLAARHPGRVGVCIGFDGKLAQQVYAGADVFVMPSKSEPCGLAQMVSCRYGTIPVVRETGGLKDSIQDSSMGAGNGFTFTDYSAHDLYDACWRAKEAYWKKDDWSNLVKYAMGCDFSWSLSAKSYEGFYQETVNLW
jgi:starch synthase